eukprot:SM000190S04851  [mRNA]  locus=s190:38964:41642:- [translate_table: standard]
MAPVAAAGGTQPWVEKYRPKQVSEVAYQEEVVRTLENALKTGNLTEAQQTVLALQLPHLLFYGPPGTGKTSTALAIARQLFGPVLYKTRVLELNASDDRGINVVRTKIKDFAGIAVGQGVSGYPCPPFKIIILDEADSMTEDAQNALRRTMETHSKITRFCFICNYVSRIIEPLASRCAKYRFKPLIEDVMSKRITYICQEEGLVLGQNTLSTLGRISDGDLRRAITTLQSAARLYGSHISSDNIMSVSIVVPESVINELFEVCRGGAFDKAQASVTDIVADGYPVAQIISQLHAKVVLAEDVTDEQKAQICECMAIADKCLIDGGDEYLQLLNVASTTMRALGGMPQKSAYK